MISAGTEAIRLYTPAELAEMFGRKERTILDWRRERGWPSVTVGRTIRFTAAQVELILAESTEVTTGTGSGPDPEQAPAIAGQSKASAARSRRSA